MADDTKTLDDLAFEVKQDLSEAVDSWIAGFRRDTSDLEGFPTIDRSSLVELDSQTRNILLAMVSDAISSIDEGEAIREKKES